jgi:50S ribosomal protein L16 3-hydroxylase
VFGDLRNNGLFKPTGPEALPQPTFGEITAPALARLHAMVTAALDDPAAFARWFGAYSSTPKYPEVDWAPEAPVSVEEARATLAAGATLRRNPASRFSFVREGEAVVLFVDGKSHECAGEVALFAGKLCATDRLTTEAAIAASAPTVALVAALLNDGSIEVDQTD